MANGSRSKVNRKGTLKIKVHDEVIQIVDDVRFVPSLRKNLILLSKFDLLCFGFYVRNESIEVNKDSLVIMRGRKKGNIYKLIGILI